MRRYNLNGKITRVVGELVETAGIGDKIILLSTLWTYDPLTNRFKESSVGSEYRDRLAQVSGKTVPEIMAETKVRANILKLLSKKGIKEMKDITNFCRKYSVDSPGAIAELGVKRQDLLR